MSDWFNYILCLLIMKKGADAGNPGVKIQRTGIIPTTLNKKLQKIGTLLI